MNFGDLELPEPPDYLNKEDRKVRTVDSKRYVIGCDPYDPDTIVAVASGMNVFIVYDKHTLSVGTKVWTKKTFEQFIEWYLKDTTSQVPYLISTKFINKDGKTCNIGETNPGSAAFERYNDTF